MLTADGKVLVIGPNFIWKSDKPGKVKQGMKIRATALKNLKGDEI